MGALRPHIFFANTDLCASLESWQIGKMIQLKWVPTLAWGKISFFERAAYMITDMKRSSSIGLLKWPTIGILNSSVPEFGTADVFYLIAAAVVVTVAIVSSVIVRCWHLEG
jgi:hypothetical protein